jgi:hypothetical protein
MKSLQLVGGGGGVDLFYLKLNTVALVRKWTIPTERQPLVGEIGANFCW